MQSTTIIQNIYDIIDKKHKIFNTLLRNDAHTSWAIQAGLNEIENEEE